CTRDSPHPHSFPTRRSSDLKNGSVCSASIADRILATAWSTLSAQASIISSPNSPAAGGVNFAASSAATRFTSLSSEPTTAWILRSEEHTSELQSLAYLVCRL